MCEITLDDLLPRLEAVKDALYEVEYLNCGGCGVVAAYMAQALHTLGIPVEVVTPAWDWAKTPHEALERWVESGDEDAPSTNAQWDSYGISRTHLAVRFRIGDALYTWDSDGLYEGGGSFGAEDFDDWGEPCRRYPCHYPFGEGMDWRDALMIAQDRRGWNSTFDRSQISYITHRIQDIMLPEHRA